jgi:hypothetical protein
MKRMTLTLLLTVLCFVSASACGSYSVLDSSTTNVPTDSQHRGFFKSVGTVAAQAGVGALTGLGGLALAKIHLVVGGIGWIAGSSFGVYSIGDEGTGRGQYWWTAAAGAGVVLAFTPALARTEGMAAAIGVSMAMIASLAAEIIVYHITEGPLVPRASFSVGFLDSRMVSRSGFSSRTAPRPSLSPCLVVFVTF